MRNRRQNLSDGDNELLKIIENNELFIFSNNDIQSLIYKFNFELSDGLNRLVKKGNLFRLEKGKYCTRNFRNPYVIGDFLSGRGTIAYWSALNLHQLTEQIPNVVYVQTTKQKANKSVFGVRYQFVKVKPEKICGNTKLGYGNESFNVTDVEKTLLDCFDLPQYSGGYEELIRAFYNSKAKSSKLLLYGMQMNNLSVLKRLAFLSELYEMDGYKMFRSKVQGLMNEKYTLLDPFGNNDGEFGSKWRLRLNISRKALIGMINKGY